MEKWTFEEFKHPLNQLHQANFRVIEDDGVKFPICYLPCSTSEKQTDILLNKQRRYVNMIVASPFMLHALEVAQFAISVEDKEAYDIVQEAINLAKGESK